MISHITDDFRRCFRALPERIQRIARKNYLLWVNNAQHPSLDFKRVCMKPLVYAVRVGLGWRALGYCLENEQVIVWFWIGSHGQYDRLLNIL